ncbi:DUF2254 domain-containing protein [Vampirovibrio sp.]|uniref:DUF2254 domain-containing protein n=1 Tax=Vampirovibrio sp. TaxID=2717857 RepID=UPI003593663B
MIFSLNDRLLNLWETLQTSLWFIPTVMVLGSIGLSLGALYLDQLLLEKSLTTYSWVFTGSPEAARQILSTIASSIITVAALAFSMTLVALTLASSQFGPRILRNFIKDTGNQIVLGTFLATYIFCLNVLRAVKGLENNSFVPQISISLAIVFLLASIGVLIYFIDHVVSTIQVNTIVADISQELQGIICRLYPEKAAINKWPQKTPLPKFEAEPSRPEQIAVKSMNDGYLQAIDYPALVNAAVEFDTCFHVSLRPGDYIIHEHALLFIDSATNQPKTDKMEELTGAVNNGFILGSRQTPTQDVEFSINQLVEIAIRALSPGINDPFSAITCIDHLANALALLFRRHLPSDEHLDDRGNLRVIHRNVTAPEVIGTAFNQIRQYGRTSVPVMVHLMEALSQITLDARTEAVRIALYQQAEMIERGSQEAFPEEYDRSVIRKRFHLVQKAMEISRKNHPDPSPPLPPVKEAR